MALATEALETMVGKLDSIVDDIYRIDEAMHMINVLVRGDSNTPRVVCPASTYSYDTGINYEINSIKTATEVIANELHEICKDLSLITS